MATLFKLVKHSTFFAQAITQSFLLRQTLVKPKLMPKQIFKRNLSERALCKVDPFPECSLKYLKQTECYARKERERIKSFPFKNLLTKNSDCCIFCTEFPHFDRVYYKSLLIKDRPFYRTWEKCIEPMAKMKRKSLFIEPLPPIPYMKRNFDDRPPIPPLCVPYNVMDFSNLLECPKYKPIECARIPDVRCKQVRIPKSCFIVLQSKDCKKKCAPYPSFSECNQPELKKIRHMECDCKTVLTKCHLFRLLSKGFTGYKY